MPGSLTHAYVFKKHQKNIFGSILPDFLPFVKDFSWEETHDLKKAIAFKRYLKKVDKSSLWLAKGMISHIVLDNAATKNKKLLLQRQKINSKIKDIINLPTEKLEFFSDLLLDLVMDKLIKRKNGHIPAIIETSIRSVNNKLIAKHIADFYKKDADSIEKGLEHLATVDFGKVTSSIQEASQAYLNFFKNEKRGFLTRVYGLYLNKILRKNKETFNVLIDESESFLMDQLDENTNLHLIMEYLDDNHSFEFNQKVYI